MKPLRQFFMEDFLEFNRNIRYNLAESGMSPRKLTDILSVLPDQAQAIEELKDISFADSPNWGRDDLRAQVADMHPGADISNVLITTGTSEALFLLFRQLKPRKIALIFPAYQLLYEVPLQQGAELINLPIYWDLTGKPYYRLQEWLDILAKKRPDVILINHPHNPSGLLLSDKVLEEILAQAELVGATVIGDEHYRFLASETELLGPTLYRPERRVFVTGSYMKCLGMSGLRIGWCVGPHETLAAMQNEKIYITHVVSPITEWLSVKILSDGKEMLFSEARSEWLQNKTTFEKFIQESESFLASVPQGGLVTCMGFKGMDSETAFNELIKQLIAKDIFALPLSSMEMGCYQSKEAFPKEMKKGIRLGLGLKPPLFAASLPVLREIVGTVCNVEV